MCLSEASGVCALHVKKNGDCGLTEEKVLSGGGNDIVCSNVYVTNIVYCCSMVDCTYCGWGRGWGRGS